MEQNKNYLEKCSQLIADLEEKGYSNHYIRKVCLFLNTVDSF